MTDHIDDLPEGRLTDKANVTTPGAMLLAAREAAGMDLAEVVGQLRLSRQTILDMESDRLQDRSALVYVRGYIRSYAHLLGLDPDVVIAAFDKINKPKKKPLFVSLGQQEERGMLNKPIVDRMRSPRNARRFVRFGALALGIIMVLLVMMWWHDQRHGVSSAATAATVTLPVTTAADDHSSKEVVSINKNESLREKALSKISPPVLAQPAETKPLVEKPKKITPPNPNYAVVKLDG